MADFTRKDQALLDYLSELGKETYKPKYALRPAPETVPVLNGFEVGKTYATTSKNGCRTLYTVHRAVPRQDANPSNNIYCAIVEYDREGVLKSRRNGVKLFACSDGSAWSYYKGRADRRMFTVSDLLTE